MKFAIASVSAALLLVSLGMIAQNASPENPVMTATEQNAASDIILDANSDRSSYRLNPLREDPKLTQAAWDHAQRMVASGALTHQVSGEPDLIVRVQQAGVRCNTVAENVAEAPTAGQINDEWMHSTAHRANLLDPRVNAIGVAVVRQHGELYAVEDFAHEIESMTPQEQEGQVASLLRARGLQAQAGGAPVHSYCSGEPARKRPLPKLVMRYSTTDLSRLPGQIDQGIRSGNYRKAVVGACAASNQNGFAAYQIVVLLY
jgi:uncharacterized protein YkwD